MLVTSAGISKWSNKINHSIQYFLFRTSYRCLIRKTGACKAHKFQGLRSNRDNILPSFLTNFRLSIYPNGVGLYLRLYHWLLEILSIHSTYRVCQHFWHTLFFTYLPMQKREKMECSRLSVVMLPVIVAKYAVASLIS